MNPILYDSTETSFTSNGLGRLTDCLECVCHEERNGVFEVDFTYPIDGKNYDLIKIGRSIGVRHDDSEDVQPFDIVSYSKPIDGVVSFHAVHISYRTAALVASARNITSLSSALSTMSSSAQPSSEMHFSLSADFERNGYMAAFDGTPRSVRQLLGGVEGSVLDTYGGEYEFNKFDIVLHKRRGIDREFRIKYGVNLLSYKDNTDAQGTFSSCIPFWKNNDAIVVGDIVDSGLPTMSGREDCAPLDLSDKFEGRPTKAQLEALALTYMQNRQTAIPKTSISVDFVRLQDIGYSGFDSLYECKLCDTIGVDFPRYGMSGRFKIVKTEFDVLRGKYNSMELGTLSTTLSEALGISVGLGGGESGGGHYSPTGELLTGSETISVPSTTGAPIRRGSGFSLDAGTWVIIMSVTFPANSTGYRRVGIGASDDVFAASRNTAAAAGGYETPVLSTTAVAPTSTTTYYAYIHHNAGASLSVVVSWRAVRIA